MIILRGFAKFQVLLRARADVEARERDPEEVYGRHGEAIGQLGEQARATAENRLKGNRILYPPASLSPYDEGVLTISHEEGRPPLDLLG